MCRKTKEIEWKKDVDKLMLYKAKRIDVDDVCPLEYAFVLNSRIRKINHKYRMVNLKLKALYRKYLGLYRTHSRVKIKKKK